MNDNQLLEMLDENGETCADCDYGEILRSAEQLLDEYGFHLFAFRKGLKERPLSRTSGYQYLTMDQEPVWTSWSDPSDLNERLMETCINDGDEPTEEQLDNPQYQKLLYFSLAKSFLAPSLVQLVQCLAKDKELDQMTADMEVQKLLKLELFFPAWSDMEYYLAGLSCVNMDRARLEILMLVVRHCCEQYLGCDPYSSDDIYLPGLPMQLQQALTKTRDCLEADRKIFQLLSNAILTDHRLDVISIPAEFADYEELDALIYAHEKEVHLQA